MFLKKMEQVIFKSHQLFYVVIPHILHIYRDLT
jgi:hypothetical protein